MTNPNKWIRKAVYDALTPLTVNTVSVPVYDIRATNYSGDAYILISTQTNFVNERTKCGFSWLSSCELQVVTRWPKNAGSRLLGDDIVQALITALDGLTLPVGANLSVIDQEIEMPGDLVTETDSEIVSQIIVRYVFKLS